MFHDFPGLYRAHVLFGGPASVVEPNFAGEGMVGNLILRAGLRAAAFISCRNQLRVVGDPDAALYAFDH